MNVLIIGNESHVIRFKKRFPQNKIDIFADSSSVEDADLICIFDVDSPFLNDSLFQLETPLLINVDNRSLTGIAKGFLPKNRVIAGFTSLPTFFEREVFEVSLYQDGMDIAELMETLNTDYEIVSDQIGLVTPRVIAMIINEAFYTIEDGTATREDIDIAMKLGTNYPYGPFEWLGLIGIKNLYSLLECVFRNTGEMRYRPCDLLQKEAEISF